jgi:hypothetical protein
MEESGADRLLATIGGGFLLHSTHAAEVEQRMIRQSQFCKMMRFQLVNAKQRLFSRHRRCFRGSTDDWICLAGPGSLDDLVREYVPNLGKDDFFEMF